MILVTVVEEESRCILSKLQSRTTHLNLRQGFHVSLEVKLSGNEKTLAVPHMAILTDFDEEGEGEPIEYVYVIVDG